MPEGDAKTVRGAQAAFGRGFVTDIWYFAALSAEVKAGRMARHEIMGEPVLIGRSKDGEVFALRDICPHRAAPLSAGRIVREADGAESVECPYHGWRYGLSGACRAIPSLVDEQDFDITRVKVRRYPAAESQGMVFIWIAGDPRGEGEPDVLVPTFPGAVGGRPKLVDRMDFEAHIDHAVVGLMDPAHGPYVHQQWWWRTAGSQHDKAKRFVPSQDGFTMVRHPPSKNSRAYALLGGEPLTEITFRLPGLRWEHVTVGERQVLSLTCLTPLSDTRTRITQIVWSDHPVFFLARPFIAAGARRFLEQDGAMVNLQNEGLKYDPSLMWIDDADRQAKWYQALKREWAAARREGRAFVNPVQAATLRWRS
ncbi:MAG TPA: aromatic ring-hydroxylating dioxygenase subunit alpha [Caulobacteraceae bacterium]|jgi:phenylpropionate dioxygenase-like ring-hydroxylating dioxygenase large terminal subunit|nr:aromatic ring-hydroxylating dioxygenase subunit alpha [Caulobacteraceae bacterium]